MKKKIKHPKLLALWVMLVILFAAAIAFKWDAVFQRGNPIPYLSAAVKLTGDHTYAAVDNSENLYITRRGDKQDLFQMIQDTYHVEYRDQLGSSYLFSDGEKNYIVGSEIYWGRFTIWTLSFDDGFPALVNTAN